MRDRGHEHVLVSNILGIISAVFVLQRLGYKLWARLDFGLDDLFTFVTIVAGVPVTVINAHGLAPNGLGRDVWTLTPTQITDFGFYFYIIEVIYFVLVATLKLSLLFFYLRIFSTPAVRKLLWGTILFSSLYGFSYTVAAIFQCSPISYFWTNWDKTHQGHCFNVNAMAWSNAAISITLDFWMLAIPLWQLQQLQLDLKKKISVALMFSVGTL